MKQIHWNKLLRKGVRNIHVSTRLVWDIISSFNDFIMWSEKEQTNAIPITMKWLTLATEYGGTQKFGSNKCRCDLFIVAIAIFRTE